MSAARKVLLTGTLLALLAGGAFAMTRPGAGATLAGWRESLEALLPGGAPAPAARLPAPRIAVEDGRTVVHLTAAERARLTLVEVDSIPIIINLVQEHGFLSVLPEQSVSNIPAPPALMRLDATFQQSLSLVWQKNALSRQAAETVMAIWEKG